MEEPISDDLKTEFLFLILKLGNALSNKAYEEELGSEFVKEFGKKLVEYAKHSYEEYQKEFQKIHKKLPKAHRLALDVLLEKIDIYNPCKRESKCLDPYEWLLISHYISINNLKTTIIRSINKHLEGLDPTQPNYDKEIKNIRNVLIYLSGVYKTLLLAYTLSVDNALSIHENPLHDKMVEQIKRLKASNDVQNYIHTIQDYIQKQIEWIDLAYQKASEYIADTIEELFHKNEEGFIEKIASALLEYRGIVHKIN
jgi:Holliday junction resolvase RusA-like endonuclease